LNFDTIARFTAVEIVTRVLKSFRNDWTVEINIPVNKMTNNFFAKHVNILQKSVILSGVEHSRMCPSFSIRDETKILRLIVISKVLLWNQNVKSSWNIILLLAEATRYGIAPKIELFSLFACARKCCYISAIFAARGNVVRILDCARGNVVTILEF
jgi:hypothetical protein